MNTEQFRSIELLSKLFLSNDWSELEKETLSLIERVKKSGKDTSYGYTIHVATTYLGLIFLQKGDIELAKSHLINSLLVPSSPYLKSSGPNMLLAKRLFDLGEKDIVSDYISLCENQWGFILKFYYIWKWRRSIKKGETPDFRPYTDIHIKYPPKI